MRTNTNTQTKNKFSEFSDPPSPSRPFVVQYWVLVLGPGPIVLGRFSGRTEVQTPWKTNDHFWPWPGGSIGSFNFEKIQKCGLLLRPNFSDSRKFLEFQLCFSIMYRNVFVEEKKIFYGFHMQFIVFKCQLYILRTPETTAKLLCSSIGA